MKVRKEHFLLPKGKTINTSTSKWIQQNVKSGEFTKNVSFTCCSSQSTTIEGLPSTLIAKIKPDVLLSNGDIILSGQPTGQLFFQQQDGILRQALLSTEKDVKSEEKATEVETGQTAVSTPALLTFTSVPSTQVIKMNDYKVILSSEPLPLSWQEGGKKNSNLPSTLPMIKPKVDSNPPLVIGEQAVTFAPIANVNVITQNQFPTIMIKDMKNNISANLVLSNPLPSQNAAPKKAIGKPIPKSAKVRKKPITAKKIMLKPASSLLSQTALDRTNQDRINESEKEKSSGDRKLSNPCGSLGSKGDDEATDYTVKKSNKTDTSNELLSSTPNVVITTHNNVFTFNPSLTSISTGSNSSLSNLTSKPNFPEDLNIVKTTESQIIFDPSEVTVIGHEVEDGRIIMTSNTCISEENQSLASTVLGETVLIGSESTVICADGQTLMDTGVIVETNCISENSRNSSDIIGNEGFHSDHVETILPSDIEHHEEHHTQEYTDDLLSQLQLTNSRVLPNISSSQVSSVLNALVPSEKTNMNETKALTCGKNDKEQVKCEPTEFVKIENLQIPNIIKMKSKATEPKYRVCELNKHTCFRCVSCSFLSQRVESVERHWVSEHRNSRSEQLDRQLTRRQIKCLGCTNIVYSKYALQIHLLCDHNVITTEVHELIATTLAANKALRDVKRPSTHKTVRPKTKEVVQQPEPNTRIQEMEVELPPPAVASELPTTLPASFTMAVPAKFDDQKLSQEPQIPPTPSFSLFSDIQLPNDKEETLPSEEPPKDEDCKKLINSKRCSRRLRRTARSKLRAEFGCEIKYNFRCMVERCGVRFTTAANLSYHLRCHRPDSDLFHCPECDTALVTWSSLTSHLWRQHGTDIDLYCCKLCGYKCNSYSKMINNHIKIHSDERPFLCDICGKGFKTTKQLRNHKAVHRARRRLQGEVEGEDADSCYSCKVCGRSFADARTLRNHTENVHNKLRPYLCTVCSHTASSQSSLRMHIRSHTGEKPFSCDECEYVTADHNSLRRHKMRHSGLRPYQCPHCSYNCIQATTYKAHLKNKHPGLDEGLMFSCPICPFRTVRRDNYLAHKAEHDLGGDPRIRRKKHPRHPDIIQVHQEHTLALCKTLNHELSDHETVLPVDETVLLEDTSDLPTEQETIELIVPEIN